MEERLVGVIGAGPVGLVTATVLASWGRRTASLNVTQDVSPRYLLGMLRSLSRASRSCWESSWRPEILQYREI